jgi:hypothetical protein
MTCCLLGRLNAWYYKDKTRIFCGGAVARFKDVALKPDIC